MSRPTQAPIALARVALEIGKEALPDCPCPKSPHKFIQAQDSQGTNTAGLTRPMRGGPAPADITRE